MAKGICSIPDCGKPTVGRSLCRKHYMRWRRTGDPLVVRPPGLPGGTTCSATDCGHPAHGLGLCSKHYQRFRRLGTTELRTMAERFWPKVDRQGPDDCWSWLASTFETGYGQFSLGGRDGGMVTAYSVAYRLAVGPVPVGLDLDHMCHNADASCPGGERCLHRRCVNPAHLLPSTRSDNVWRGLNRPS